MKESELALACDQLLDYRKNLGELLWFRLPCGDFFTKFGTRVRGNEEGTSDRVVIRWWYPLGAPNKGGTIVTFIEYKNEKGRQREAQKSFQKMVEMMGCAYKIIRSTEELEEVL